MQHSEKEVCLYCKFYKQTRIEHGQCRRNPPVGIGDKFAGKWPEVADMYWCGEFKQGLGEPEKISATNFIPRPKRPGQPVPAQSAQRTAQPAQRPVQTQRPKPGADTTGQIRLKPQQ
jgi:hypothetical protein